MSEETLKMETSNGPPMGSPAHDGQDLEPTPQNHIIKIIVFIVVLFICGLGSAGLAVWKKSFWPIDWSFSPTKWSFLPMMIFLGLWTAYCWWSNWEIGRSIRSGEAFKTSILHQDFEELWDGRSPLAQLGIGLIPPAFTAVGILFTFIGLSQGVEGFNPSEDSKKMLEGINTLIQGVSIAFSSSIFGITFSVLVSWIFGHQLSTAQRAFNRIQHHALIHSHPADKTHNATDEVLLVPEVALAMLYKLNSEHIEVSRNQYTANIEQRDLSQRQLKATQELIDISQEHRELSREQLKANQEQISATDRMAVKLQESLSEAISSSVEAQKEAIEKLIYSFEEHLTKSLGERFVQMENTLTRFIEWNESSRKLYDTAHIELAEATARVNALLAMTQQRDETQRAQWQSIEHVMVNVSERFDAATGAMSSHVDALATHHTSLNKLVQTLEGQNERLERAWMHISDHTEHQEVQVGALYDVYEQLINWGNQLNTTHQDLLAKNEETSKQIDLQLQQQKALTEQSEQAFAVSLGLTQQLTAQRDEWARVEGVMERTAERFDETSKAIVSQVAALEENHLQFGRVAVELGSQSELLSSSWKSIAEHTEHQETQVAALSQAYTNIVDWGEKFNKIHQTSLEATSDAAKSIKDQVQSIERQVEQQRALSAQTESNLEETREVREQIVKHQEQFAKQQEQAKLLATALKNALERFGSATEDISKFQDQISDLNKTIVTLSRLTKELPEQYRAIIEDNNKILDEGLRRSFLKFENETTQIVQHLSGSYISIRELIEELTTQVSETNERARRS